MVEEARSRAGISQASGWNGSASEHDVQGSESAEVVILGMCRYYSWSSVCGGAAGEAGATGCGRESGGHCPEWASGLGELLGYIKHPGSGQRSR